MEWHEIIIETKQEAVELIASTLYDLGVKGLEIIDNSLSKEERDSLIVDYIDDRLQTSDIVKIKCYFSAIDDIDDKMNSIQEALNHFSSFIDIGAGTVEKTITKDEDWANNWKQYYKPFRIGKNILIKPTWETVEDINIHDIVIEIDPGMAFGCGTHETTSMCTLLIQKYMNKNDSVIDVGCGSGILGIVAAKLGAKNVEAIDLDPAAIKVAKENVEINNLVEFVDVYQGNLLDKATKKADLVVANIMADIIIVLVDDIRRILKKEGLFISSGIIIDKKKEVMDKIEASGFEIIEVSKDGDWIAITAKLRE